MRRKRRASKPNVALICLVSLLWTSRQNSHKPAQTQNATEMQMSVKCVLLKHLSGQTHQEGFSSHQPFASLTLKSCHFHENASPSSEMYPKSLWGQRGPNSLQAYCLYHRTGWCFCCNLICFFADILEMYESIIPLSQLETTSYWEHFLLLPARKAKTGWIITTHSRQAFSISPVAAIFFVQGSLKRLHWRFLKFLELLSSTS